MANNMILNQLKVRGLYGLYDYDLDFEKCQNQDVQFITAPNGFGKSTILRIIEGFFMRSMSMFVNPKLKYKEIEFDLPKYRVVFAQNRMGNQDVSSDEDEDFIEAVINVFKPKGKKPIETKTINSTDIKSGKDDLLPNTINIYLKSKQTHLVEDNRLWIHKEHQEEHIVQLVKMVRDVIDQRDAIIMKSVYEKLPSFMNKSLVGEVDVELKCSRTCKLLSRYHKVGIALEFSESKLKESDNSLRVPYILALSESLNSNDAYLRKLEQLADWIGKCEFANKKVVLRKKDGIFFEAQDFDKTPILPEELSSGEKQIVVQAIELLFRTPSGSVVLIDEPELSYHVAWQMIYYDQISSIAKQCKLQCIIASHNPQMFNYDWDSSIDLFTQYEQFHNQQ